MTLSIETHDSDVSVELIARVALDGDRFVAAVDGLPLEGTGSSRAAAENALVQVVRGWLERQDTAGRLADALGVDLLDEDTEIVLQFVDSDDRDPGNTLAG